MPASVSFIIRDVFTCSLRMGDDGLLFLPHGSQAVASFALAPPFSLSSLSLFLSLPVPGIQLQKTENYVCLVLAQALPLSRLTHTPGVTKGAVLRSLCSLPHTQRAMSLAVSSLFVCCFHLLIRNRHHRRMRLTHSSGPPFYSLERNLG